MGELPEQNRRHSIYGPSDVGSFKFYMIRKMISQEGEIAPVDSFLIHAKYLIRRLAGSPIQWFGLKTSNVVVEYVPLFLAQRKLEDRLERVFPI